MPPRKRPASPSPPLSNPPDSRPTSPASTATNPFTDVTCLADEYRITEMQDSSVYYVPDFVDGETSKGWYEALKNLDSWYRPTLKMYGRSFEQSRSIAAYANEEGLKLKYSGQDVNMLYEYPEVLKEIQAVVEERLGVRFNHVMLNNYENGSVYIGNHRDNIENRVIASVSVGAPRTFVMTYAPPKVKSSKKRKLDADAKEEAQEAEREMVKKRKWMLADGSLVVMQGETQTYWKHEIPKEPKVKEGRISLTFRQLIY